MKEKDIIDAPFVEVEVVDYVPGPGAPAVLDVPYDALPPKAVSAPRPEELWKQGYFQKGGRPGPGVARKYPKPEDMKPLIDQYFAARMVSTVNPQTGETEYKWLEIPDKPGLCLALGLTKSGFDKYHRRDEYAELLDWALLVIESAYAGICATQGNNGGVIFLLKQKDFGYSDTQTFTFTPPNRLEQAKTVEQIAELIDADVVTD